MGRWREPPVDGQPDGGLGHVGRHLAGQGCDRQPPGGHPTVEVAREHPCVQDVRALAPQERAQPPEGEPADLVPLADDRHRHAGLAQRRLVGTGVRQAHDLRRKAPAVEARRHGDQLFLGARRAKRVDEEGDPDRLGWVTEPDLGRLLSRGRAARRVGATSPSNVAHRLKTLSTPYRSTTLDRTRAQPPPFALVTHQPRHRICQRLDVATRHHDAVDTVVHDLPHARTVLHGYGRDAARPWLRRAPLGRPRAWRPGRRGPHAARSVPTSCISPGNSTRARRPRRSRSASSATRSVPRPR